MRSVWAVSDFIVSPLGMGSTENFTSVVQGRTAIRSVTQHNGRGTLAVGKISDLPKADGLTMFENVCSMALEGLLSTTHIDLSRTLLVLSTTKGNIELLEAGNDRHPRLSLHGAARFLADKFGFTHHVLVSNACISGVLAMIMGKRFIQSGKYDHAVIVGADVLTDFVVSGFESLQALSGELCKPFDRSRKGINLGEGAGAVLLTTQPGEFYFDVPLLLAGEGVSNDANHISGPSRTGEELALAIDAALRKAGRDAAAIDFISAHGTATVFNDEMESKAFGLAGLYDVPLNSLKGYYGHTLGAAGVIESIIAMHSLRSDVTVKTMGFENLGVTGKINVCATTGSKPMKRILKTASGFGGCNAALVLEK